MSNLLIAGLHPVLAGKALAHRSRAYSLGIDFVFTAGYRTPAEQTKLYAQGRTAPGHIVTNAMPEHAPHCRRAAYDLVPIVNERAAWDRIDLFTELGRIGVELGLVWGGSWPKLKDFPHFELPGWREMEMPK